MVVECIQLDDFPFEICPESVYDGGSSAVRARR